MVDLIITFCCSFYIAYLAIPVVMRVAKLKRLYDVPDDRKLHERPIAALGGVAIFGAFMISVLIGIPIETQPEIKYCLAAVVVIFFVGLKDDILIISPIKKFIGQVVASFLIIYSAELQLNSMHGFLGIEELPLSIGIILTYFTVMVIINSFNLIDGVDGLAGSLGVIASLFFGIYFYLDGSIAYSVLGIGLAGSLIAFLRYNFQPAKIFMGDTGSMIIGTISAVLVIKFIQVAQNPLSNYPVSSAVALGFTVIMVPLLDTLRVFAIRLFYKRSPFIPDCNHVHHLMLDRGFSHQSIAISISAFTVVVISLVYTFRHLGNTLLVLAVVALFYVGVGLIHLYKMPVAKKLVEKREVESASEVSVLIVPKTPELLQEQRS
jgi:UDP-N-acetylmuramyl pentapeptide phosphotransferase/UDP-N-acetylglucosamine-1-phosphate transferase